MREIEEEIGKKAIIKQFIGAVESSWHENDQEHHEINLLFEIQVPDLVSSESPVSQESHLEFIWASLGDLKAHNLLPEPMIGCLISSEFGFHGYWVSSFDQSVSTRAEQLYT